MKFCGIILNRNLPKVTDKLFYNLKKNNKNLDIFIVESGSDKNKTSKNMTWHANWPQAKKNGLRYYRGMNYGLRKLYDENKFYNYDAFILLSNDTLFKNYNITKKLTKILNKHKRIGLLSPCAKDWGEYKIIDNFEKIKYFWFIHSPVYVFRRSFIDDIKNTSKPGFKNFLFDGSNFRGFGLESEIIMKAYSNDWAAAITKDIIFEENENLLIQNFEKIKTENYSLNTVLFIEEGFKWMKKKYGFDSKWSMQMFVKCFYDKFFESNPVFENYKI